MSIKKTQKPLLGVAALLILIFHLLPVLWTGGAIATLSQFVTLTAYIGVDMFFFLSGYVLVFSRTDDYFAYLKRRVLKIYPIFLLSGIVYMLLGFSKPDTMLKTWLGISLLERGGGSFLWFLPSIMAVYILEPFYLRLQKRLGALPTLISALAVWTGLAFLLENTLDNHSVNIFLMRLPIVLLGIYFASHEGKWRRLPQCIAGVLLFGVGVYLTWSFGFRTRLSEPLTDMFYLAAIPETLGIILLGDALFAKIKPRVMGFLGRISLELYCVQMTVGALLFGKLLPVFGDKWLASISAIAAVVVISYLLQTAWNAALRKIKSKA